MRTTSMLMIAGFLAVGTTGSALASGLSEPQARAVLADKCDNVSTLSQDAQGGWHGSCSKGAMKVDPAGKVGPDSGTAAGGGITEGQALYDMSGRCDNVSSLSEDNKGNWHGVCSKGAMMVTSKGDVVADKGEPAGGLMEGNARAIADRACDNVSSLSEDAGGHWLGMCSKGAFVIDPSGKIAFH